MNIEIVSITGCGQNFLPNKVKTYFVYGAVQANHTIANHTPGSGAYTAKFNFHSYHSGIILY